MNAATLRQGRNDIGQDCWMLNYYEGPVSVELQIRYYFGDEDGNPNHYRVFAAHDDEQYNVHSHGYREVITNEELLGRAATCAMHEGDKEAKRYVDAANQVFMVIGKYNKIHRIANQLKGQWEQLLTVINPFINL